MTTTDIDPTTGLPKIPDFLITDERPEWRWEVRESVDFWTGKLTGYTVQLNYRWQYDDIATIEEPSRWRKLFGAKPETTVVEGEVVWTTYEIESIDIEDFNEEAILRAAEKILSREMPKHERSKLLGAYPPKRLDKPVETE